MTAIPISIPYRKFVADSIHLLDNPAFFSHCIKNDSDGLLEYIRSGGDINEKNEYGTTALHSTAGWDSPECMKVLLNHGAAQYINDQDGRGNTPLHIASIAESPECLKMLVNYGADPSIKNAGGLTCWDYFKDEQLKEQIYILHNCFFEIKEPSS